MAVCLRLRPFVSFAVGLTATTWGNRGFPVSAQPSRTTKPPVDSACQAVLPYPTLNSPSGQVAEWSKALDSKSSDVLKRPWVQIPPCPPTFAKAMRVRSEVYLGSCLDIQHFGGVTPFSVPAPNGLKSCSKAFKYLAAPE